MPVVNKRTTSFDLPNLLNLKFLLFQTLICLVNVIFETEKREIKLTIGIEMAVIILTHQ